MKTAARPISKSRSGLAVARRARSAKSRSVTETEKWPEISPRALATFATELEAERRTGQLSALGKSSKSAAAALRQAK